MKLGIEKWCHLACLLALATLTLGCGAGDEESEDGEGTPSTAQTSSNESPDSHSDEDSDEHSDEHSDEDDDQHAEHDSQGSDEPSESDDTANDEGEASVSQPSADRVQETPSIASASAPEGNGGVSVEAGTTPPSDEGDGAPANNETAPGSEQSTSSSGEVAAQNDNEDGSPANSATAPAEDAVADATGSASAETATDVPPAGTGALRLDDAVADSGNSTSGEAGNASAAIDVEETPSIAATESASSEAEEGGAEEESGSTGEKVTAGDWPMWGGTIERNMYNATTPVSVDFDPHSNTNILWTAELGSQTYGNPVIAGGRVYVGTNNGAGHRPNHPAEEDRGVLLCVDEESGELLWQLTRLKLESGRVNDWPLQGICSSPAIVGDMLYVVTNRCELMCIDVEGFHDGENDGVYQDEVDAELLDADIVWSLDLIKEFGVFPHNLATSSPVVHGDMVYALTSNGVDEAHLELPAPRSPCFVAVNRHTGELVWDNNDPFDTVLHGQWSSPAIGIVDDRVQVYFPGGDGILRALDGESGDEIWRFDLNPKNTVWELGGRGSRNAIISTPVFYDDSVILAVGQDPEHGEGVGHLYRINARGTGDLSAEIGEIESEGEPNPNSGVIWYYGGVDEDGSVTGEAGNEIFRRTMSTVAVANGLVIAPDLSGRVHCVDAETGERYWEHDLLAAIWGSPMVADGKVFLGDEVGDLNVFELSKEENLMKKIMFPSSIYSTPTIANGVMYISDRSVLYAIKIQ